MVFGAYILSHAQLPWWVVDVDILSDLLTVFVDLWVMLDAEALGLATKNRSYLSEILLLVFFCEKKGLIDCFLELEDRVGVTKIIGFVATSSGGA